MSPGTALSRRATPKPAARGSRATPWIAARFGPNGRACLFGCLLLAPVAFYHRGSDIAWTSPKVAVLWFGVLGALAFWAFWSWERRVWPPRFTILWAAASCVGAATIATAFSISPRLSLVGLSNRYGGLLPLTLYAGAMVAVVGLFWERPQRLRLLLAAVCASAAVQAVSVLLQQAGIDRALWGGPVAGTLHDYPPGLQGQSNFAGAHLGMAVPCLWYLARTSTSRRWRTVLGAVLGVVVLALWCTQSRGGMLAGIVGLAAMAYTGRRRQLRRWTKVALAAGSAVVLAGGLALALTAEGSAPPGATGATGASGADLLRTKTLGLRISYWRAALRIIADHPVVGTGPDTFYAYYPAYRPASDGATLNARLIVDKPHNVLLEHATDAGVPGLTTYLAVVGLALLYGGRRCRRASDPERALLAVFIGLLCAYLAQSVTSIDEESLVFTGWVAIGGVAALADPVLVGAREALAQRNPRRGPVGDHRTVRALRWRRAAILVAAPLAVGAAVIGLAPLRADLAVQDGRFAEAVRVNPLHTGARMAAAVDRLLAGGASSLSSEKRGLLEESRERFLDLLRLKPRDIDALLGLASVETAWASGVDPAHFRDAETWWRRTLVLDPNNRFLAERRARELPAAIASTLVRSEAEAQVRPADAGTRVDLAYAYLAKGESSMARETAGEALRLDPSNDRAGTLLERLP